MNIFTVQSTPNDDIQKIKRNILHVDTEGNQDMEIDLKGYMHNDTGFVLSVKNVEKLSNGIMDKWKTLIQKEGYRCDFTYDFHDGWVDIRCHKILRKKHFWKVLNLQQMLYLSGFCFSIYMLWQKHSMPPE